jgi:hypothetical protein
VQALTLRVDDSEVVRRGVAIGSQGVIPGSKAGSLLALPFPPTHKAALYPQGFRL